MKKKYIVVIIVAVLIILAVTLVILFSNEDKSFSTYVNNISGDDYHGADVYDETYIEQNVSFTGTLTFVGENQTVVEYVDEAGIMYYLDKTTGTITQSNMLEGDEGIEE